MYDIVEYLNRGIPSAKLRKHLPYATSRPQSQKEFVQQIRAISAASVPRQKRIERGATRKIYSVSGYRSMSGRRSQQSKVRVAQMKRHYGKKETVMTRTHSTRVYVIHNNTWGRRAPLKAKKTNWKTKPYSFTSGPKNSIWSTFDRHFYLVSLLFIYDLAPARCLSFSNSASIFT